MISHLPLELYQNILQFCDSKDLASLSCVSRTLQIEAERHLYSHVDLLHTSAEVMLSWCKAIVA